MLRVQPSYIYAKMSVVHCNNAHELVGWGLTAISRHGQRLDESNGHEIQGAFHLRKKTGNFGGSKSGISDR